MPPFILPTTTTTALFALVVPHLAFVPQQQQQQQLFLSRNSDYAVISLPTQSQLLLRSSSSISSITSTSLASSNSGGGGGGGERTQQRQRRSNSSYSASTVIDPHGPTPHREPDPFPEIDLDSLPEAHYDEHNHPIPHQPWRRGDTDGCHDPISAPWRLEAEAIISDAASLVGCSVVDVTWYMAKVVISLDDKSFKRVVPYVDGPEVRVAYPDHADIISGPIYNDPTAGTDDELFTEEDEYLDYEQYDEETEYQILKSSMPAEYDEQTGMELPPASRAAASNACWRWRRSTSRDGSTSRGPKNRSTGRSAIPSTPRR